MFATLHNIIIFTRVYANLKIYYPWQHQKYLLTKINNGNNMLSEHYTGMIPAELKKHAKRYMRLLKQFNSSLWQCGSCLFQLSRPNRNRR